MWLTLVDQSEPVADSYVTATPVVITGLGDHLTEDGDKGSELGWLRRHGTQAVQVDDISLTPPPVC